MPSVIFSKKEVLSLLGKDLSDAELSERIPMLGTDLEKIEGDEIHVEIFPNRPDLLSEQGFARALSSFLGIKTGLQNYSVVSSGKKVIVDASVTMRPYTACAIVKNITFNDSRIREIMQIQEKLALTHGRNRKKSAYGLYPTKPINFPIHYIAKDPKTVTFWPLGMPKAMRADDVEELHPKGSEYKWIAQGWKKYPFFIDSKDNVLCMLPYTNSHDTGKVDETTNEVFIECTGTDFKNVSVALNIFVTMLADMGGQICSVDIVYPDKTITTPELTPEKMKIDIEYVNKILGIDLDEKKVEELLNHMGYGYEKKSHTVLIPAYRADILHQVDFVEDIAIAYGYENFTPAIPKVATIGSEAFIEQFKRSVSELLVGLRLTELYTYTLTGISHSEIKCLDKKPIALANALTEDYNCLRASVLTSVLDVLSRNKHNEYPQHVFDAGTVFSKSKETDTGILEQQHLAIALCDISSDYTKIKQVLDYIARHFSFSYTLTVNEDARFIKGRAGIICVDDIEVGVLGEISPEILSNCALEYPIAALEINLSVLLGLLNSKK